MPGGGIKSFFTSNLVRRGGKICIDLAFLTWAYYGAFLLRFDGHIPQPYFKAFLSSLPIVLAVYFIVLLLSGVYRDTYRYASIRDLTMIGISDTVGVGLVFLLLIVGMDTFVPRSVILIFWLMALFGLGAVRFAHRMYTVYFPAFKQSRRRLLVVGAGNAAEMLVRQMLTERHLGYKPVLFVDDENIKQGNRIHGLPVAGPLENIPQLVKDKQVHEIIIAAPSASAPLMRRIVALCQASGVVYKILPGLKELVDEQFSIEKIRDVRIEDLLERVPVETDTAMVQGYLKGRVVLVTGAAGSIGSELCRQLVNASVERLILIDRAESDMYDLENKLKATFPTSRLSCEIADILNVPRLKSIFEKYQPEIVFHAAAYKHVPMMEAHPDEAVMNNVFGTIRVSQVAKEFGVERFVLISTDKAVNPTSVMGATKRVAEQYCVTQNGHAVTKHVAVRFGNVLDSKGSVVPLFKKQIRDGGPVTVTDIEVKRYFMTIPEAVELVLQASVMGDGGEIFILDMGEPVRVYDMARHLISLSGLEPDKDIEIRITGLRPGEKLSEELWHEDENPRKTRHPSILQSAKISVNGHMSDYALKKLRAAAEKGDAERIGHSLKEMVPTYTNGAAKNIKNIVETIP